jgi:hypothetical protein
MTEERYGPGTARRRHLLGVIALCVLALIGTAALVIVVPYKSPLPFVGALVMQAFVLAWIARIAWSWRRAQPSPRAIDVVLATVPLLTGALALALLGLIAGDYGIRGSALPRVRSGKAGTVDYAYLGATGVVVSVMAAAVVLLVLQMRTLPSVRALSQRAGATAGRTVGAVEEILAVPDRPRQSVACTFASDSFWRRLMGPSAWVLFGICAVLSVPGLWLVAADFEGSLGVVGGLMLYISAPVTAWAVLQSVWRRDENLGVAIPAVYRSLAVPVVTAIPISLLQLLVVHLPVFAERVRSFQRPDEVYEGHYWFPLEDESLFASFVLNVTLGGAVIAGVTGLVVAVFLVLPITAFRDPDQFIREQGLSGGTGDRSRNAVAVRVLALVLPLAFVVPALVVGSDSGDPRRWIGIALAVGGVGALSFAWRHQRVDFAARGSSGMPLGVLNPDDRKRLSAIDGQPDHRQSGSEGA